MEKSFDPTTQELVFKPEYLIDYPNVIRVPKGYMDGIKVFDIDLSCNQETMQSYYNDLELKFLFDIIDKPV
jgi:hypothetical protein